MPIAELTPRKNGGLQYGSTSVSATRYGPLTEMRLTDIPAFADARRAIEGYWIVEGPDGSARNVAVQFYTNVILEGGRAFSRKDEPEGHISGFGRSHEGGGMPYQEIPVHLADKPDKRLLAPVRK